MKYTHIVYGVCILNSVHVFYEVGKKRSGLSLLGHKWEGCPNDDIALVNETRKSIPA